MIDEKMLITTIYDLLANNSQYQPRDKWSMIEAEDLEDYWVDTDEHDNLYLGLRAKNGDEYRLTLHKTYSKGA